MEINSRITRVREDIRRTETKVKEMEMHLKDLRRRERQMVDEEIIRQVRALGGPGSDILEVLAKAREIIGKGTVQPGGSAPQDAKAPQDDNAGLQGWQTDMDGAATENFKGKETDHE